MNQLEFPLSRSSDPHTSHDAAEKAGKFKCRHIAAIYNALCVYGAMTPREIEPRTGLQVDYIGIQRRGAELERKGLITRGPDVRDGQKVWRAK